MKILYLTPGVFDKGGIARYNRFQIRALRETFGEKNIRVLSLMGRQIDDLEEQFEVDYAGAMPLTMESRALFSYEAMRHAVLYKPHVVHCSLLNFGPLALACSKAVKGKLVQNIYGREIWSKITYLRKRALLTTDLVIADSINSAKRACELGLVRKKPEVIWDCVNTEKYTPGKPRWFLLKKYNIRNNGKFKVLFLGKLNKDSRYKGYERLLHVITMLPDKFEAIIAGKGDDYDYVNNLVNKLNINNRVVLTGGIHENEMVDVYRCADVFYLVSESGENKGEGIPLTPMEAMSCGVPVLVGNQDGSRELLEKKGGWCGEPKDLEGQKKYIEMLASNKVFHNDEKKEATKRARIAFNYERFKDETKMAINKLLNCM